jgi:hypothetical protein
MHAMKKLVGLLVLAGVVVLAWWGVDKMTTQDSFLVSMAFGFPKDDEIEMHVVVSMGMTALEAPRLDPLKGKVDWEGWVTNHFELQDAAGHRVQIFYKSGSDVIPANKVRGVAEGYLFARLRRGVAYTLEYAPKRAESTRFTHGFTAPDSEAPLETPAFRRA